MDRKIGGKRKIRIEIKTDPVAEGLRGAIDQSKAAETRQRSGVHGTRKREAERRKARGPVDWTGEE